MPKITINPRQVNTALSSVRDWLEEGLTEAGILTATIGAEYLGDGQTTPILALSQGPESKTRDITGQRVLTTSFVLGISTPFGADARQNLESGEYVRDILNWIDGQFDEFEFPNIPGYDIDDGTATGSQIVAVSETSATYQITITLHGEQS